VNAAAQRILVASSDDVCAAPLVAAILRSALEGHDVEVAVTSAGTEAELGQHACSVAVSKLADRRVLDAHRSVPINAQVVRSADLVLVMDRVQRAFVNRIAPGRQRTVFTLREAVSLATLGGVAAMEGTESVAELAAALHRRRGLAAPRPLAVPRRGLLRRPVAAIDVDDLLEGHRLDEATHVWAVGQTNAAAVRFGDVLRRRLVARWDAA
jgi:protein-tyrosine-phosphatase